MDLFRDLINYERFCVNLKKRGLLPKVGGCLKTEMMLEFVNVMQRRGLFSLLFWVEVQQKTCVGAIGTEKSVFYQTFEP
jgi:hypothetical protein